MVNIYKKIFLLTFVMDFYAKSLSLTVKTIYWGVLRKVQIFVPSVQIFVPRGTNICTIGTDICTFGTNICTDPKNFELAIFMMSLLVFMCFYANLTLFLCVTV